MDDVAAPQAVCQRSGSEVVLKAYALTRLSAFLQNQVLRELHVHSGLQHPGVVQLLAAFRVSRGTGLGLGMARRLPLSSEMEGMGTMPFEAEDIPSRQDLHHSVDAT